MIWRKRATAPAPDPWEEEGRRLAPLFSATSSAVVVANDPDVAARVAVGIARVAALERRVALGDLTGESPTLAALGGGGDAHGITDSFLYGVSLNAVARPAADGTPSLFVLPCGSESVVPDDVLRSDRWQRLAAGFADAGALLLLVAKAGAPGLAALVVQTDGAISVADADIPLEWRVIAQAGDRTPPAPRAPGAVEGSRRPWSLFSVVSAALLIVTILIAIAALWPHGATPTAASRLTAPPGARTEVPGATSQESAPSAAPTVAAGPADTVRVPDPVNPPDAANAAEFAVELVATNTATGANLWLRERGASLPAVTVSSVVLGATRTRWFKVIAGAWRNRAAADSMLGALRAEGVLRDGAGVVVRVPLALLLEAGVPAGTAPARVAAMQSRGVPAYALVQDDGSVRLFAGAFETAAAAVPLDAELRAAGLAPQLAYRTGRTF
jgi:hypothetical protein